MVELGNGARVGFRVAGFRQGTLLLQGGKGDKGDPGEVPATRQVRAGDLLLGGGSLAADVELDVDLVALDERIRDVIAASLRAGANVTITTDDGGDTITIASSGAGGSLPLLRVIRTGANGSGYQTTNTSFTAIDNTNLAPNFAVPASGQVRVVFEATCTGGSSGFLALALLDGGNAFVSGSAARGVGGSASTTARVRRSIIVGGLNPGANQTLKAAYRATEGVTVVIPYGNANANDNAGPVIMEVWAA